MTIADSVVPSPQLTCPVKVPTPPDITPAVTALVPDPTLAEEDSTLKIRGGGTLVEPEALEEEPVPRLLDAVTVKV